MAEDKRNREDVMTSVAPEDEHGPFTRYSVPLLFLVSCSSSVCDVSVDLTVRLEGFSRCLACAFHTVSGLLSLSLRLRLRLFKPGQIPAREAAKPSVRRPMLFPCSAPIQTMQGARKQKLGLRDQAATPLSCTKPPPRAYNHGSLQR